MHVAGVNWTRLLSLSRPHPDNVTALQLGISRGQFSQQSRIICQKHNSFGAIIQPILFMERRGILVSDSSRNRCSVIRHYNQLEAVEIELSEPFEQGRLVVFGLLRICGSL